MGTTVNRQREAKRDMDHKLSLSKPDRALLEELAVAVAENPSSPTSTFQYAFALSKSGEPSELRYAVNMLDALVVDGKFYHQVDCMFGAATALYLLGEYEDARVRLYVCEIV
jgi:mitochondrial fission 1 protein